MRLLPDVRAWAIATLALHYPTGLHRPDVTHWALGDCEQYLGAQPKLHRFLVALDMALGQWGGGEQDATISSRTALQCLGVQTAGTWALVLGALLERLQPGHLYAAMVADYCRARLELRQ